MATVRRGRQAVDIGPATATASGLAAIGRLSSLKVSEYEGSQSENERDKTYWGPVIPPKGDVISTLPLFPSPKGVVEKAS